MPAEQPLDKLLADTPVPEYARKLRKEWRSLLVDESTEVLDTPSDSSFLYRPRTVLLDPAELGATTLRRPGESVGEFRLERLVGQGSMGQVWEALQVSLQRPVALKLIRPDLVTPELLRYFRREGRAGARLTHPGIVGVYAMGQSEGVHWIAQEFVEGECNFSDFLSEVVDTSDLPQDYDRRIALFFYQLADALQYAHDAGIIHRDLKPQNVMIAFGDRPKIADFGLARIVGEGSISDPGTVQGTPRYMSPEQALGLSDHTDGRSDVFGLGAMLYQALTLQQAFPGETMPEVLAAIHRRNPTAPTKIRSDLSRDLEAIALKALEKRPSDRYATAGAFAEDLAAYLDGRAPVAKPLTGRQALGRWVRSHQTRVFGGALVTFLALSTWGLSRALSSSQEGKNYESWRVHVSESGRLMERGSNTRAIAELEKADSLRPDSPETALLLAGAYARLNRYRAAERQLQHAIERGYDPSQARSDSARDQYLLGLYVMTHERSAGFGEAAAAMQRAAELDPDLDEVWYPLYQMYSSLEEHEKAAVAVEEFRKGLTLGDPQAQYGEALALEQRRQPLAALGKLDALLTRVEATQQDWDPFMAKRAKGRLELSTGDFEAARTTLREVVESVPADSDSLVNLGWACVAAASEADPDSETRRQLLAEAEAAARHALEIDWNKEGPLATLAIVEHLRNQPDPRPALEAFREFDPSDPRIEELERSRDEERAISLWADGQYEECVSHCRSSLESHVGSWLLHSLIAQDLFFVGTMEAYQEGLLHMNQAVENWRQTTGEATRAEANTFGSFSITIEEWNRSNFAEAMLVFRFYLAALVEDAATAQDARNELEAHLLANPIPDGENALNYAEALVMSPDKELRDLERAQEMLDTYLDVSGVQEGAWPEQYAPTIENIRAALRDQ